MPSLPSARTPRSAGADLPSLRKPHTEESLRAVFCAMKPRRGFRIVHYSIQTNHVHLIVEAESATALSRGMQALAIRIAQAHRASDLERVARAGEPLSPQVEFGSLPALVRRR